ncbi:Hint domain-containing protein [Cognatishimia sp. F0-27]|uniref:Hint domain-containing protein n=1 Tax=Cognatishimia sp. F0-27 TaxID=2816855 RepID=UPI001D0C2BD1|nr:Hint domain-containing protein [Cognatishimia sp. F0-27]MCC1494768.1 Hint domain-containing protein [Cognatishimia sp. F0-27]
MLHDKLRLAEDIMTGPRLFPPQEDNALTAGTLVMTLDGPLPVEYLGPGDLVFTSDGSIAPLLELRCTICVTAVVCVARGAFGANRPDRSITLPASQTLHLSGPPAQNAVGRDTAQLAVGHLMDGRRVVDHGCKPVTLYALIFERRHFVQAHGLALAASAAPTVAA